jgi:mRNA-degrading endonuclease toxin of MazEF toxin-antitoxin module
MPKGEVWQVDLVETIGHEQFGTRPALIIGELARYRIAVIIPFTKNISMAASPYAVLVQPNTRNGLDVPSVALVHQIRAIDMKLRLLRRLGNLDSSDLLAIDIQLRNLLHL